MTVSQSSASRRVIGSSAQIRPHWWLSSWPTVASPLPWAANSGQYRLTGLVVVEPAPLHAHGDGGGDDRLAGAEDDLERVAVVRRRAFGVEPSAPQVDDGAPTVVDGDGGAELAVRRRSWRAKADATPSQPAADLTGERHRRPRGLPISRRPSVAAERRLLRRHIGRTILNRTSSTWLVRISVRLRGESRRGAVMGCPEGSAACPVTGAMRASVPASRPAVVAAWSSKAVGPPRESGRLRGGDDRRDPVGVGHLLDARAARAQRHHDGPGGVERHRLRRRRHALHDGRDVRRRRVRRGHHRCGGVPRDGRGRPRCR